MVPQRKFPHSACTHSRHVHVGARQKKRKRNSSPPSSSSGCGRSRPRLSTASTAVAQPAHLSEARRSKTQRAVGQRGNNACAPLRTKRRTLRQRRVEEEAAATAPAILEGSVDDDPSATTTLAANANMDAVPTRHGSTLTLEHARVTKATMV